MKFSATTIDGVHIVDLEPHRDDRGYFARTWCIDEFADAGLTPVFLQASVSFNHRAGTLRGMHLQRDPHGETKLIRCLSGAAYDVLLDLRTGSGSYLRWEAFEISEDNGRSLFVPPGIAHGFQTLVDGTTLGYHIDERYSSDHAAGFRWNDPAFGIDWPDAGERIMSDRDATWPDYQPNQSGTPT